MKDELADKLIYLLFEQTHSLLLCSRGCHGECVWYDEGPVPPLRHLGPMEEHKQPLVSAVSYPRL